MKCLQCKKNKREYIAQFGYVNCAPCRKNESQLSAQTYDFVPDRIKQDRLKHKNSMIQPFRNGQLSKEYIDLYGTKYIEATEDEVKNAKNVWPELEYYKS